MFVKDKNGNLLPDHKLVQLLNEPNYSQSQSDFLYKHLWFKSLGNNITRVGKIRNNGSARDINNVSSLEHLIPTCINYKEINKQTKMLWSKKDKELLEKEEIGYTLSGQERKIPLSDLIFFYDVTNGMRDGEFFKSPSRITSLIPALSNIQQAQESKNINLKWSSKFLTSNKTMEEGMVEQMKPEEKREIEETLHNKDIIATQSNLDVHSLANDFRRLMYDDQMAADLAKVLGAFGIPKEVFSWYMNGQDTYANKSNAVVQWIQNSIMFEGEDFGNSYQSTFGLNKEGLTVGLDYSHLPVMAVLEEKRLEAKERKTRMFQSLVGAGVDVNQAMIISELDKELENE